MSTVLTQNLDLQASSLEWLGSFPSRWKVEPGLAVLQERQVKNVGMIESRVLSLSYGRVIIKPKEKLRGLVPESFETYQIVEPGNIIIRPTDLQNDQVSLRVGRATDRGIITSAYLCLETKVGLNNGYAHLLLHAYDLKKVFYGLGSGLRQNLSWLDFRRLPIPVPPLEEQEQIVRFVRHLDARVNKFVKAKRRLIELLTEQKQVTIHRAVTRGLDPTVPLKPSGIEWLGSVPEHWKVLPLKRWVCTRITDGPHETPEFLDFGVDFISAEAMVNGKIDFSRRRGFISRQLHERYSLKCRPRRNDIFMCKSGATTGKVAIVETDMEFSVWSPLALIRTDPARVIPRLLFRVLQCNYVMEQVRDLWSYGTQPNLGMSKMERIAIVLPGLSEQEKIIGFLESELSPYDRACSRATTEIDLIREYRTRLVADVVTGQLDVRHLDLPEIEDSMLESIDAVDSIDVDDSDESEDGEP